MEGNLSHINLNDVLLLATAGKKSGVLKLSRGNESVDVYLSEGDIVHATCPIGEGEKALHYPVTWREGIFTLLSNDTPPLATIKKPSSQLLDEMKAITREWETILEVIPSGATAFRIADLPNEQNGPITVSHSAWRVLSKIDGNRTVQEIAEILRVPYGYTAKVILNLHKAGLIEVVTSTSQSTSDLVPAAFFNRLVTILTDIIGPMAPMVVRDEIQALGEFQHSFPEAKLDKLIALISKQISDAILRSRFEKSMVQEISN